MEPLKEKLARAKKLVLIGCAGFVITVVIWLFVVYIFISAPWALFYDKLQVILKNGD
jgi:hypothetical protein